MDGLPVDEQSEVGAAAIGAAIAALSTDLDHLQKLLVDDGLAGVGQDERIGVLCDVERFRNRLSVIDHLLVEAATRFGLADHVCQPSVPRLLTSVLRISGPEAAARVRAADALGPRLSMLGERLDPIRPTLAAAQSAGDVTPEQADLVIRGLDQIDRPGFDPAQIDRAEEQLTTCAASFSPRELKPLIQRVIDWIDPDGTRPTVAIDDDRRHLLIRQTRTGAYTGEFRLTSVVGAKLVAILTGLAKPRPTRYNTGTSTDAGTQADTGTTDAGTTHADPTDAGTTHADPTDTDTTVRRTGGRAGRAELSATAARCPRRHV